MEHRYGRASGCAESIKMVDVQNWEHIDIKRKLLAHILSQQFENFRNNCNFKDWNLIAFSRSHQSTGGMKSLRVINHLGK